jgi:eukaryotic-like serine/threonine-protein kinase
MRSERSVQSMIGLRRRQHDELAIASGGRQIPTKRGDLRTVTCAAGPVVYAPVMARLTPGTTLKDTYRVVKRLGGGGMGEVYEAEHTRLAGRYAIKLLLPEAGSDETALRRFRREAEIASSLQHPNIVQVIDFDATPEGAPYLVMELLKGLDLDQTLSAAGKLPPQRVVDVVEQTAAGLSAAHAMGIVHRDLKPANVFVVPLPGGQRDLIKLVDFGISKILAATTKLTADASIIGTPRYMSPEQATGSELGPETDQFALAVIARELLTGQPPFNAETFPVLLYKIVHEEPLSFADLGLRIPVGIEAVLNRAMRKRPSERFGSVSEFSAAFRREVEAWLLGATIDGNANPQGLAHEPTSQQLAPPEVKVVQEPTASAAPAASAQMAVSLGDSAVAAKKVRLSNGRRALILAVIGMAAATLLWSKWQSSSPAARTQVNSSAESAPPAPPAAPPPSTSDLNNAVLVQSASVAASPPGSAAPSPAPSRTKHQVSGTSPRAAKSSSAAWSDLAPPNPYKNQAR